jgi:hypothetical protein
VSCSQTFLRDEEVLDGERSLSGDGEGRRTMRANQRGLSQSRIGGRCCCGRMMVWLSVGWRRCDERGRMNWTIEMGEMRKPNGHGGR